MYREIKLEEDKGGIRKKMKSQREPENRTIMGMKRKTMKSRKESSSRSLTGKLKPALSSGVKVGYESYPTLSWY